MGWASASGIFDSAVSAAIEAGLDGDKLTQFATNMIDTLSDQDWDTQDESVEQFRNNPYVVKAFEDRGYRLPERAFSRIDPALAEVVGNLRKATTSGAWVAKGRDLYLDEGDGSEPTYWSYCDNMNELDVRFVAYAHQAVPLLLEEIRRLKARLWEKWADDDSQ